MATTLGFKNLIDLPEWYPLANAPIATGAGVSLACDLRNSEDRHPVIYQLVSNTVFNAYNVKNDEWAALSSPALAGTFGAGAGCVFVPHAGPTGAIGAGATTTTISITIPVFTGQASSPNVGINQLANRGDGRGFKIRVIGNTAGGSGKTEERLIIANTGATGGGSGTVITVELDSALSFTPANGDAYEILAGRVYLLGASTLAAGMWKFYDVCTNAYSGNLATTNLPATVGTDTGFVSLSESHVPSVRSPGEGFLVGAGTYNGGLLGCLTATATAAGTLTGEAAAGDSAVLQNEFRNFQLRIVEDTATPQAVGQRRQISSHTAGASPVYTLASNWATTPSATAKYVLECFGNLILCFTSASTSTFTYSISGDAWSTATFGARGGAPGQSPCGVHSFSLASLDTGKNARWSHIFTFRGGVTTTLDVLDIAGGAAGSWSNAIVYGGSGPTFTGGTCVAHAPATENGAYFYINQTATQRFLRFDMKARTLEPWGFQRYWQSTAVVGARLASTVFVDGATKATFIMAMQSTGTLFWRCLVPR